MTKRREYHEARRLRQEHGLSLKEIAERLQVAKSSVSKWVRDLELTDQQKEAMLRRAGERYAAQTRGAATNATKHRLIREQYQQAGREKAREGDPLHLAGCMLYWAEGSKSRNILKFVNSDVDMIMFYMRFLRDSLRVTSDMVNIYIHCYLGNGLSQNQIENFWLNKLNLPRHTLKKTIVRLM